MVEQVTHKGLKGSNCIYFYVFMHVCLSCACGSQEGQKRALDLLKLELQMVVNHCIGAGN